MEYLTAYHTEAGAVKTINQDSVIIMRAQTASHGPILLAGVFDGMGGLAKGELASGELAKRFAAWFTDTLPPLLLREDWAKAICLSCHNLLLKANQEIGAYGQQHNIQLGTTATVLFLCEEQYLLMHVGDSRAYQLGDQCLQLTVDQTVAQREIDNGTLGEEEARKDPRSHILLQCVGVSKKVAPAYYTGEVQKGAGFFICCDGFFRKLDGEEIHYMLFPGSLRDVRDMEARVRKLADLCKKRGERDNLTAVFVKAM